MKSIIFKTKPSLPWTNNITLRKPYAINYNERRKQTFFIDDVGDCNYSYTDYSEFYDIIDKRPHYDLIIAYAAGANIEAQFGDGTWYSISNPGWYKDENYRIAVVKEREFPKSSVPVSVLSEIYNNTANWSEGFIAIANEAIKQYILDTENGHTKL